MLACGLAQPRQIISVAVGYGNGDYFGNLVRVHKPNPIPDGFKFFLDGFDNKEKLRVTAQFTFPSINRPDAGNDIDATSLAGFHKRRGYALAKFHGIDSAKYNYFTHIVYCITGNELPVNHTAKIID